MSCSCRVPQLLRNLLQLLCTLMCRRSLNLEYVEYCQERFEIGDLVEVGLGANDLPAGLFDWQLHTLWPFLLPHIAWHVSSVNRVGWSA